MIIECNEFDPETPVHLGDGVYASFDGFQIKLSANVPTTGTIYLPDFVLNSLIKYANMCFPKGDVK